MSANNLLTGRKRLDSWKEIAAFFGRDERTVNRWEKELGLPVHRLPGTKGRVYAFAEELSAWLASSKNADSASTALDVAAEKAPGVSGLTLITRESNLENQIEDQTSDQSSDKSSLGSSSVKPSGRLSAGRYRNILRFLAAASLVLGAVALVLFHPGASRAPKTVNPSASLARQSPSSTVLASTPAHDPQAEQLYLKGRFYWNKRTPDDLNKALDYFMQAVVHDPNYAQAYVGLADCYNLMREYTLMPSSEAYPRALVAAKKAVELDDQSSEAHASLAFVSFFGTWDLVTGEREFRRAIDLNPNNPAPHHWYANALMAEYRLPEALVEIDRAQALDPASAAILADKGNLIAIAGKQAEAITLLKQMEIRDPGFRSPHGYLKAAYFRNRDYPNYLAEWRKEAALMHDDSSLATLAAAEKGYAAGGERGMFEATLQSQKKLYAQDLVSPTVIAQTFAMLGNSNEALRYLKIAYEQRDATLLFVQIMVEFDSLHNDPAYRDLLARMNLPVQNNP